MTNGIQLWNFVHWLGEIVVNHSYANQWLSAMPAELTGALKLVGAALVSWMGG